MGKVSDTHIRDLIQKKTNKEQQKPSFIDIQILCKWEKR